MPYAVLIDHVEHCGECVFSGYRNFYENGTALVCGKLSQEETMPFQYVTCARGKNVRPDCPLPKECPDVTTPQPAPRPLSSLTEGEAKMAYELAFPGRQFSRMDRENVEGVILVGKDGVELWLFDDGDVVAQAGSNSRELKAGPLVRYLDSLGIALGQDGA